MAITTYAELQAAAANWLVRGDLTARIPEFIALAEARLNRVLRLRLAEKETVLTLAAGARAAPLPSGFTEPMGVWINNGAGRRWLRFAEPSLLGTISLRGEPGLWSVDGANLVFDRPCDQAFAVTLRYLERFQLTDEAPVNALLSESPDVYLFATLSEAGPFLRDAELAAAYEQRLARAIDELGGQQARSRAPDSLTTEVAQLVGQGAGA